jgi:queuine/archaeosine tRNA-ribosyltransferase
MLGLRLNTLHNLWYFASLMKDMRSSIEQGTFDAFRQAFYRRRQELEFPGHEPGQEAAAGHLMSREESL